MTLDISQRHQPTICTDLLEWDPSVYPADYFDYIHASCPCEAYSRARTTGVPRPLDLADSLVKRTLEIFEYFKTAVWTVENPAGSLLWQRPVAQALEHIAKTSYCRYGFPYRKSTWFANNFELKLRPQCDGTCGQMVGSKHKEWAQRGVNTKKRGAAVQRNHTIDQLHGIPPELCSDILAQAEAFVG